MSYRSKSVFENLEDHSVDFSVFFELHLSFVNASSIICRTLPDARDSSASFVEPFFAVCVVLVSPSPES